MFTTAAHTATETTVATAAYLDEDVVVINDLNTGHETTLLHHCDIDIAVTPGTVLVVNYDTEYVEDWETGEMVPQHTLMRYSTAI